MQDKRQLCSFYKEQGCLFWQVGERSCHIWTVSRQNVFAQFATNEEVDNTQGQRPKSSVQMPGRRLVPQQRKKDTCNCNCTFYAAWSLLETSTFLIRIIVAKSNNTDQQLILRYKEESLSLSFVLFAPILWQSFWGRPLTVPSSKKVTGEMGCQFFSHVKSGHMRIECDPTRTVCRNQAENTSVQFIPSGSTKTSR